jgi:hypothetical protein
MEDIIQNLLTYRGIPPPPNYTPPGDKRTRPRVFVRSPTVVDKKDENADDRRGKDRRKRDGKKQLMKDYPPDGEIYMEKRQKKFRTMLGKIDAMLDKKRATLTELRALRSDLASLMD